MMVAVPYLLAALALPPKVPLTRCVRVMGAGMLPSNGIYMQTEFPGDPSRPAFRRARKSVHEPEMVIFKCHDQTMWHLAEISGDGSADVIYTAPVDAYDTDAPSQNGWGAGAMTIHGEGPMPPPTLSLMGQCVAEATWLGSEAGAALVEAMAEATHPHTDAKIQPHPPPHLLMGAAVEAKAKAEEEGEKEQPRHHHPHHGDRVCPEGDDECTSEIVARWILLLLVVMMIYCTYKHGGCAPCLHPPRRPPPAAGGATTKPKPSGSTGVTSIVTAVEVKPLAVAQPAQVKA